MVVVAQPGQCAVVGDATATPAGLEHDHAGVECVELAGQDVPTWGEEGDGLVARRRRLIDEILEVDLVVLGERGPGGRVTRVGEVRRETDGVEALAADPVPKTRDGDERQYGKAGVVGDRVFRVGPVDGVGGLLHGWDRSRQHLHPIARLTPKVEQPDPDGKGDY